MTLDNHIHNVKTKVRYAEIDYRLVKSKFKKINKLNKYFEELYGIKQAILYGKAIDLQGQEIKNAIGLWLAPEVKHPRASSKIKLLTLKELKA